MTLIERIKQDGLQYGARSIVGSIRHPGFRLTLYWRFARSLYTKRVPFVPQIIRQLILLTFNCDLSLTATIGSGLRIPHPVSIVIGNGVIIGRNVLIMQGVTLGGNRGESYGQLKMPIVGDTTEIGPYALILGPVTIPRDTVIDARRVVTRKL